MHVNINFWLAGFLFIVSTKVFFTAYSTEWGKASATGKQTGFGARLARNFNLGYLRQGCLLLMVIGIWRSAYDLFSYLGYISPFWSSPAGIKIGLTAENILRIIAFVFFIAAYVKGGTKARR